MPAGQRFKEKVLAASRHAGKGGAPDRRVAIRIAVAVLAPDIPAAELGLVVDHATHSPGLRKAKPPAAAWLSLIAFIRHRCTDYDDLLADGYGAEAARHFSLEQMNRVLEAWGCRRRLDSREAAAEEP